MFHKSRAHLEPNKLLSDIGGVSPSKITLSCSAQNSVEMQADQVLDLPELPPEIWTEIFKHLSPGQLLRMRLVCRRWRDIAIGRVVLRHKLKVTFSKRITIDVDYAPDSALLPVGTVKFEQAAIVGVCSWWPSFGPGLVEMRISDCSVGLPILIGFLQHTPNIRVLQLSGIKFTGEWNKQADLSLCKLESLWLDEVDEGLDIFKDCDLKILRFTWEDIEVSTPQFINFVSRFQSTLEELYLTASDDVLTELMKLARMKLKKIMLSNYDFYNNQLIVEFCRKQPLLEDLDIKQILTFDGDEGEMEVKEIGQLLPRLKSFSLNITPETLLDLTFLSKMPQLKNLKIDVMRVDFPADVICPLCPNLREVSFSCVKFNGCCLQTILKQMSNIHAITLKQCEVDCWSDLIKALCSLKLLRSLTLWFSSVREPIYSHLESDLSNLKHLKIFLCDFPQDLLAKLLTRCPNLEEIDLQTMYHALDEESVRVIGQELPRLNQLTVDRSRLSEAGERFIREHCDSLQVLEIKKI